MGKYNKTSIGESYTAEHRRKRKWKKVVVVLSCFVIVGTVSALTLPAITMNQPACGLEEHQHSEECNGKVSVLACNAEIHQHTEDCRDAERNLVCRYADFVIHEHDGACLDADGNLVCSLPEVKEHQHDNSCYQLGEETIVDAGHKHSDACYSWTTSETSSCGLEASEGHTHDETCRSVAKTLICTEEEKAGHTHNETCHDEAGEMICGMEEDPGHQHSDTCYTQQETRTCEQEESTGHQHDDTCFQVRGDMICTEQERDPVTEPGERVLICNQPQAVPHTHRGTCYWEDALVCEKTEVLSHQHTEECFMMEQTITCGKTEHTHDDSCKAEESLTEEERAQVEALIAMIEDLPMPEELAAQPVTMEDQEIPEIQDLQAQVTLARNTYNSFTEPQQAAVTNEPKLAELEACLSAQSTGPSVTDLLEAQAIYQEIASLPSIEALQAEFDAMASNPEELAAYQSKLVSQTNGLMARYEALHEDVKAEVTNLQTLVDLIAWLEEAVKHPEPSGPDYTATSGDITAQVTLDGFTMPDGVVFEMGQHAVDSESYQTAAAQVTEYLNQNGGELLDMMLLNPHFSDASGAEVEPGGKVKVTLFFAEPILTGEGFVYALHITPDGIENATEKLIWTDSGIESLTIVTDSFSDFPVVLASGGNKLTGDDAHVTEITVTSIKDGMAPWDDNSNPGNDANDENKIVRTFDTVAYNFNVKMDHYDTSSTYSDARVKMEFVLPLTAEQAVFDQSAMAWMDQTAGYAPVLTTENRIIDGETVSCQVLTCYKHLLPSSENPSVVPGEFGENLTIQVKSMKNGETFAPIISAAMEFNTWDGDCHVEGHGVEKKSVTPERVMISAAPKYNVYLTSNYAYKQDFDFTTGGATAPNYAWGSEVPGRLMTVGVTLQLYNDYPAKRFKGIELPQGDITFDLNLKTEFYINTPNAGSNYKQGQTVDVTKDYPLLLWVCDGNKWGCTSDGRTVNGDYTQALTPWNVGSGKNACYQGGTWSASQDGSVIHITVSGYKIDIDQMPTQRGDTIPGNYGEEVGVGCFSAGAVCLVQPYNKQGSTNESSYDYDVVQEYGQGLFHSTVNDINLSAVSVGGTPQKDADGTNDAQMNQKDDYGTQSLELRRPGFFQNRVSYRNENRGNMSGDPNNRTGKDYASVGTKMNLRGGFSYNSNNEQENALYFATNLTKFYGHIFEITGEPTHDQQGDPKLRMFALYATKPDGTDWVSDEEMKTTYENGLKFYTSPADIPQGHVCVGVLYCFVGPGTVSTDARYNSGALPVKLIEDMNNANQTYQLVSTSRAWTKQAFDSMSAEGHPTVDTVEAFVKSEFPKDPHEAMTKLLTGVYQANASAGYPGHWNTGYMTSANITGSTWYYKTVYADDWSCVVKDHESDWTHWGDTLLVIGYKSGIAKEILQKADGQVKTTYNLDAEQRIVDFKLQPRTYFEIPSIGEMVNDLTTSITIVDTLPNYLHYIAGSSYWGGTYTQTSEHGGTQGAVTGGMPKEPEVSVNSDGTTTLTWIIEDKNVGESLDPIHYSVYIGDRNNPDKDVPTGTTNMINAVRVSATYDKREPTKENGNYVEVGLAATRGTASSFGKYTDQTVVEPDGKIDYVVYFNNNAQTSGYVTMMDTMPYHGVNGSAFTGTYTINQWKLDTTRCDISKLEVYYTMDEQYKDQTTESLGGNEAAAAIFRSWERAEIGGDGSIPELVGKKPVAWAVLGTLGGNQSVRVNMQLSLSPAASEAGQQIQNNIFVNTLSSDVSETIVRTPTVNRSLEGLTWEDKNGDGIQDEVPASRISGVKVTLLKLKDGGDPTKESDYEPYHYQNDPTKPVVTIGTGQQVSVLADGTGSTKTYEQGRYKFNDLPAGVFGVRFESGSYDISYYYASPVNRGNDDTRDSDGLPIYSNDGNKLLEQTTILGITLPAAQDMQVSLYESKYHDSGFHAWGAELPQTGGPGTSLYIFSGLLLMGAAALIYKNRCRKRK